MVSVLIFLTFHPVELVKLTQTVFNGHHLSFTTQNRLLSFEGTAQMFFLKGINCLFTLDLNLSKELLVHSSIMFFVSNING